MWRIFGSAVRGAAGPDTVILPHVGRGIETRRPHQVVHLFVQHVRVPADVEAPDAQLPQFFNLALPRRRVPLTSRQPTAVEIRLLPGRRGPMTATLARRRNRNSRRPEISSKRLYQALEPRLAEAIYTLVRDRFRGIIEAGANIGFGQPRIAVKDIRYTGAVRKFAQNELNRNARVTNHGFAEHNRWINFDSIGHCILTVIGNSGVRAPHRPSPAG